MQTGWEEKIKTEAGRREVKIVGRAWRSRWVSEEAWRKEEGRVEGGGWRWDVHSSAGAWHSVHVCVLGGNLIQFQTWRWWQRQRARREGRREGGRKARADSPCADRNRRNEGEWVRRRRKKAVRARRRNKEKESEGIMRGGKEKDAFG